MYRGNEKRDGYTSTPLPRHLSQQWVYQSTHQPKPAWPSDELFSGEMPSQPGDRDLDRMHFDIAYQPIVIQQTVFFGSSADDRVHAFDLETGEERWTFCTGGPIRFAPVGWRDRIVVASDDGWLYALAIEDGKIKWKKRGGPSDRKCLGNGRLVSHWPLRGGPVLYEDTIYFSAGIWPSEGIYVYALDMETGNVLWCNDQVGGLVMPQPHGGAVAKSGISPQGYLAATEDYLIVPNGRSTPAVFQCQTGELEYYHLGANQWRGGTRVISTDRHFFNAGGLFDLQNGLQSSRYGGGLLARMPDGMIQSLGNRLIAHRLKIMQKKDRKGAIVNYTGLETIFETNAEQQAKEIIVAASTVVMGEAGHVRLYDLNNQTEYESVNVDGNTVGLAVSDERLIVSTDRGLIYCFGENRKTPAANTKKIEMIEASETAIDYVSAAKEIIRKSGITNGFCVDLGGGTGELALELAKQTQLQIYIVEPDEKNVSKARDRLANAGLYGVRVTVHTGDPSDTGYPSRFANLVVSSQSLSGKLAEERIHEMSRLQRPYGGKRCIGGLGKMEVHTLGPPEGAGSWTHQNANAANTLCSSDNLKAPLIPLWYRDIDFEIANRHGQAPAPLFSQGILVAEGVDGLCALDAYNGNRLWTYEIEGILKDYDGVHHDVAVGDTGSNYCLSDDSVYVRMKNRCLRIDLATGRLIRDYRTPAVPGNSSHTWGYLAYCDGMIYGTVSNRAHKVSPRYTAIELYTESVLFFALDAESSGLKWSYQPKHSIRNNAIAVTGERVFLIDRPLAMEDRITDPKPSGKKLPRLQFGDHPFGELIAFDAKTGDIQWQQNRNIYGTQLSVSEKHQIVLMHFKAVKHNFFELPSEIGGRLAAFDAKNGNGLWDIEANYVTRPLINDRLVFAEGGMWNLKTGAVVPTPFQRSYGCGQICASTNLLLYRSATLGYWDLIRNAGTENFGGIRTGCWFNAIPAGGLVLIPDGASKCACSYQMKAWVALQEKNQ